MKFTQSLLAIGALVLALALPNYSCAKSSIDKRLERVENIIESQLTVDNFNNLESIKQDMRELRGILEEQQHEIALLKQQSSSTNASYGNAIKADSTNMPSASLSIADDNKSADEFNSSADFNSEKYLYNAAYKLVEEKKYQEALLAYKDFLWSFPEGKYAPNAHYWLGEIYLTQWNLDKTNMLNVEKAIESFQNVVDRFPKHHKAIDSLLKLGIIHIEQKNWNLAKSYLVKLKEDFPDSSRAQIARSKLDELQEKGLM